MAVYNRILIHICSKFQKNLQSWGGCVPIKSQLGGSDPPSPTLLHHWWHLAPVSGTHMVVQNNKLCYLVAVTGARLDKQLGIFEGRGNTHKKGTLKLFKVEQSLNTVMNIHKWRKQRMKFNGMVTL